MQLVGFSGPNFYKFCEPKYNIADGCNTIRLGTLWGFRDEENEKLRDDGEGLFEYKVKFQSLTPVSNEWISEFSTDTSGSAHIGELQVNDEQVSVREMTLSGSHANCWIYCVSAGSDSVGNISEAHSSKWEIPEAKISDFGGYLAQLLWENITASDLPDHLVKNHTMQEIQRGLSLNLSMNFVEYKDRVLIASRESDIPVAEIRRIREMVPFIKPKVFSKEREFRFVFSLVFNGKRVSIQNNEKILSLRPIDRMVRKFNSIID